MNIADHLRPLLRDHDCVIIPDFGGLVADYTPAQVRPGGRHLLLPPTRQVAFNQALTRNDGLLVDALRQHLDLPAADAREAVRQAVANLHQQLRTEQRTELPGIGVFRQLPGRGLQFEYTGTDCLLPAAFGLPEVTAHPVRVLDARQAREQQAELLPRLRSASKGLRRRLVPAMAVGMLAGVAVAALYLLGLHPEAAPVAVRPYLPSFDTVASRPVAQQATLGQATFAPVPTLRPTANAEPAAELTAPATTVDSTASATPVAQAAPTQTSPLQGVPNAAETLLEKRPAPRPRKGKVPVEAAVALANSSNVARPVPLAYRRPNTPGMTTTYPVAPATAKLLPTKPLVAAVAPKTDAVPAAPVAKPVAAATTGSTIKQRTGRFYLVVGAFSDISHAEKGRTILAHTGRPAKVILPHAGTRKYRITAGDFPDLQSANVVAARLRQNPNFKQGVTVYPY